MSSWKRRMTIGIAVAAVAAGITIALVSGGGHARKSTPAGARRGDLVAAADYLGIRAGKLRLELREGKTMAQLARQTPGRSETGLVEAIVRARAAKLAPGAAQGARLRRIRARAVIEVQQPFAALSAPSSLVAIAARYLGRRVADVRDARRSGQSLAALADATPGRSAGGLTRTLEAQRTSAIRTAYARGAISAQAQQRLLAGVARRVAAAVTAP